MGLSATEIEQRLRALVGNPLFEAARLDDVELMKSALSSGRSLNERRPESGFTPLHIAALNGSNRFLEAALNRRRPVFASFSALDELKSQMAAPLGPPEADPWIRDNKGMLAMDHAEVRRDREAMRLLYAAMYPDGAVPFPE